MDRLRIVVDTNLVISASMKNSSVPLFIMRWINDNGTFLYSDETIEEIMRVSGYKKLQKFIDADVVRKLLRNIKRGEFITPDVAFVDCADADDNKFLDLAVSGRAHCLVSGDKRHLLPLHPFKGIPILSPADFLITFVRPHKGG